MENPRQAVILIHGVGEQRPMETLRGFVAATLDQGTETGKHKIKYYNRPDLLADNLELRRLVSARGEIGRTDFYEFYWAHLMPTSTWGRLVSWFWILMWRRGDDVPKPLKPLWVLSWVIAAAVLASGLSETIRFLIGIDSSAHPVWKMPWLVILIGAGISLLVRSFAGDAAVYLSPRPENIEARQKIRAAGLALLNKVAMDPRYDRIIIVGHSLGSMIGYDILTFAWQRHNKALRSVISAKWEKSQSPSRVTDALKKAEDLARELWNTKDPTPVQMEELAKKWQAATRAVDLEQRANQDGWLVTDFVTLGSPLTYSSMLLAKDLRDFKQRAKERELPLCPPALENGKYLSFAQRDTGDPEHKRAATVLNDGAVFAVVAWTNLYFPSRYVLKGDILGGPIAQFSPGVRDVIVETNTFSGWFAHINYWELNDLDTNPQTAPLVQLRIALNLKRENLWPAAQQTSVAGAPADQPAISAPGSTVETVPPDVETQELGDHAD